MLIEIRNKSVQKGKVGKRLSLISYRNTKVQ